MKLNSPLKTFWECDRSQSWTNWRTGSSWGKSWAWQAKPRDKITEVSSAINVLHYLNQTLSGLAALKTFWECHRSLNGTIWRSWGTSWRGPTKHRDKITEVRFGYKYISTIQLSTIQLSGLAASKTFWECHRGRNGTIWSSCWTSWGCRCGCDRNPWEKFIQKEQKLKENLVILYIISCYWMPLGFQKMSFFEK